MICILAPYLYRSVYVIAEMPLDSVQFRKIRGALKTGSAATKTRDSKADGAGIDNLLQNVNPTKAAGSN